MPVNDAAAAEFTAELEDADGNSLSDERFRASSIDFLFRLHGFLPRMACVFELPEFSRIMGGLNIFERIPTDVLHQFCEGIAPMVFELVYAVMKKSHESSAAYSKAKAVLESRYCS